MKLDKTNVCVFIENEAHLQQAREVLERYGHKAHLETFFLSDPEDNFMYYYIGNDDWRLAFKAREDNEITLSELEEILKEEV